MGEFKTVTLPTGGQAVFRPPDMLLGRGKKTIRAALIAAAGLMTKVPAFTDGLQEDETPEQYLARLGTQISEAHLEATDFEALQTMREAAVIAQLDSWTLDIPKPTMRTIGDLPGDLYDALIEAAGETTAATLGAGFQENDDPESPTTNS